MTELKQRLFRHRLHILWQSLLVFVLILAFMMALKQTVHADVTANAIGATSLGSTAFLLFIAPHTMVAQPRRVITGYVISMLVGSFFSYLLKTKLHCVSLHCEAANHAVMLAAISALLSTLLMVFLTGEHPPAVGFSIGLVLWQWNIVVVVVVIVSVIIMVLIKELLKPFLENLL